MNIRLVEQLQKLNEEDLFPEASEEEIEGRKILMSQNLLKELRKVYQAYKEKKISLRELEYKMYEMCDEAHADCGGNRKCAVHNVFNKAPGEEKDFEVNRGCDCFKDGKAILDFLLKHRVLESKINEEDLFPEASPEELADRERNRPPRVLVGNAENHALLVDTLIDIILDLGRAELRAFLYGGESKHIPSDIGDMSGRDLWRELIAWVPAYIHNRERVTTREEQEKIILKMIDEYEGEKFDKIEGF